MKKLRSFISYYEVPGRSASEKGEEVGHLAAHFDSLDQEGKKALARDWANNCGPKGNLKAYLSQTLTVEKKSTGGQSRGYMTPTQIAEKLAIQLVQLPPPELQKTLEAEIKANQDAHKIPEEKRQVPGSSFWLSRFYYIFEKALDESHSAKSVEELNRSGDWKPGESAPLSMLGCDADPDKEEKQAAKASIADQKRLKKANNLVEALMKSIQMARTQVLVAKSKKEEGLKEKVKVLERIEMWAVEALSSLQESTSCTQDQMDEVQEAVRLYKSKLQDDWLPPKKRASESELADAASKAARHGDAALAAATPLIEAAAADHGAAAEDAEPVPAAEAAATDSLNK